jgi:hypothetical protein
LNRRARGEPPRSADASGQGHRPSFWIVPCNKTA